MIARHFEMRDARKSSFSRLAKYITDARNGERLGQVRVTNCHSDPQCLDAVVSEILAVQQRNVRARSDKTYHLLVSFRPGEALPPDDVLAAIEERLCAAIGFAEHQRISAVHRDTDNYHLHIAINKIHPERLTILNPYQCHNKLMRLCEVLEAEYGLQIDNHEPRKCPSENRADDMERHSGLESLVGWIRRSDLPAKLEAAESWEQLHALCQENGLSARLQGNGLVFEADNGTTVKASTVSRNLSKGKLEARLGAFVAARGQASRRRQYQPRPIRSRVDTTELYARYQREREALTHDRQRAMAALRAEHRRKINSAKRRAQIRRGVIKWGMRERGIKRMFYNQVYQSMRREMDRIYAQYRQQCQAAYERTQRPVWADWLKIQAMQGDATALAALRARAGRAPLAGDTMSGRGTSAPGFASRPINITKKGTILYRMGESIVRDDGERLHVSDAAENDQVALRAALRLAMVCYGNTLKIDGSDRFRESIARIAAEEGMNIRFSDVALERRRRELMAGHGHERGRGR